MKIGVKILPRDVILDTQGRAVEGLLSRHYSESGKHDFLENCRVGRYVELNFTTEGEEEALSQAKEVTEFVLHNPLIEKYELEVL